MWIYYKIQFIPLIKAVFSASLLQSSVSHDPSEIILIYWFPAQETFLIIINVENSCAGKYFCENHETLSFRILWWTESSKEQHLFEIEIFCNIINALLSLLNNLMCP